MRKLRSRKVAQQITDGVRLGCPDQCFFHNIALLMLGSAKELIVFISVMKLRVMEHSLNVY